MPEKPRIYFVWPNITLPTLMKHGLMVTLDHACEITTLWPKDEQPSGRVAQPHEENTLEGTP